MEDKTPFTQFAELYREKGLTDSENQFVQDGIIDSDLFYKQATRILFIAKEHNALDKSYNQSDAIIINDSYSYPKWWNHRVYLQFSHRISEWAHGILSGFSVCEKINSQQKHNALKSIAFTNVKKTMGGAVSNSDLINSYIVNSRELLHRQIAEISPTVIICCFRYNWYVERLFNLDMKQLTPNGFGFATWNNIDVINFYHPSSRKNKSWLYTQLAEAVKYVVAKPSESQALQ